MDNKIEQKRDRKGLVVLVLLLVAIVSTTFAVTFSRYMSSAEASTEATVARWQVKLGKHGGALTDITQTEDITLDNCTWNNDKSTAAEGTMAPGSTCEYQIDVENNSQVDAVVKMRILEVVDENDDPVNNSSIDVTIAGVDDQHPLEVSKGTTETVTLNITWAAGSTSLNATTTTDDTNMGKDPGDITIRLGVDAEQKINP